MIFNTIMALPINIIVIILVWVDVVLLTVCSLALKVARYHLAVLPIVDSDVCTNYDDDNQYNVKREISCGLRVYIYNTRR